MAAANIPTLRDAVSDDLNYEVWAPIVKRTLAEKGLWDVVENGTPPDPSKIPELAATIQADDLSRWRDSVGKDTKALQILQSSIPDSVFRKTLEADSAKHLWDLLKESDEQAKLEKRFQQLRTEKRERLSSYIDKVAEVATDPRFAGAKSKLKSTTKLISLSDSIDGAAPVMNQLVGLESLTFNNFRELLRMFESVPVETFYEKLKASGHHEAITKLLTSLSDSYIAAAAAAPPVMENLSFNHLRKCLGVYESLPGEDICRMLKRLEPQSKEDSTKSKDVCRRNQQKKQERRDDDEVVPEYVSYAMYVGDLTYDEDMWMIYTTTTNHMTPYEKHFTNLDRTRRAKVTFIDGSSIMAQGTGDVRVLTREGKKKTIKNVLYVPGIVANALSVGPLSVSGFDVEMDLHKVTIRDEKTRKVFGETRWEENRGFCLRLQAY
ncbi:unnamed protein product [Microthlaspi erraticum]|uniref:Retrovirus-related Pol polyprotein from transposon TNT 1-94-like beta-barrel domain-containing protein n=1 Tax=Microthlaspi erraticum TaxID=1685480 RepID=A0A6D2HDD3_9BRAS|nr:unnamed protein product [Microthlaspi erraticum]